MKDLSAFATPALELKLRPGRHVSIQPPSTADGARLAALTTVAGALASGEVSEEAAQVYLDATEDLDDEHVKRLAVGDAYDYMVDQGWSYPDIELVSRYATFYWVFGEEIADQIMESMRPGAKKSGGSGKSRKRGKNGRRTA